MSDLHLRAGRMAWVVEHAASYDLVLVAGDTLDASLCATPAEASERLIRFVRALAGRTRVAICSGNHDLTHVDDHGERAAGWTDAVRCAGAAVDGDLLLLDRLAVSVCPWWDGPLGAARVRDQLERQREQIDGRRWIWLHHAPPARTCVAWDGRLDRGDEQLALLLPDLAPDLVVSGHVHEAPHAPDGGWFHRLGRTLALNPGQVAGGRPASLAIDTAAGRVVWHSAISGVAISESAEFGATVVTGHRGGLLAGRTVVI